MRPDQTDQRRWTHDGLAVHLAGLSDDVLAHMVSGDAWRSSVHGSQSGVMEIEGVKVFVKKIALTDLERGAEGSTANLFDLPLFYQYGIGSAGFGAWRELKAYLKAGEWALSGACPHLPIVYHWRILPRTAPTLVPDLVAWLDGAVAFWDGSEAVAARLAAIADASASIVLFMEYAPQSLDGWLKAAGEAVDEAAVLRFHDQLRQTAAFLNDRGMLHFDLHAHNVLTDGDQIVVADFGLAICADFDLSAAERAFLEAHSLYDRAYVDLALSQWISPPDAPRDLTPVLQARFDECTPVAAILRKFLGRLAAKSKSTPYPAAALETALRS